MEQADIAEELLKKLKITQVHFLSHDYGDTVALEMLARSFSSLYFTFDLSRFTIFNICSFKTNSIIVRII